MVRRKELTHIDVQETAEGAGDHRGGGVARRLEHCVCHFVTRVFQNRREPLRHDRIPVRPNTVEKGIRLLRIDFDVSGGIGENHAGDFRMTRGIGRDDGAAVRMADDDEAAKFHGIDDGFHVVDHRIDRVIAVARRLRLPHAAQIERHRAARLPHMIELRAPLRQIAGVAVHEEDRHAAAATAVIDMQSALRSVDERWSHVRTGNQKQTYDGAFHRVPTRCSIRRARSSRVATKAG